MDRFALENMKKWKNSPRRKPLVVMGARQVGKTWLMKEFGRQFYSKVAYVSFYNNKAAASIFETDFEIKRILSALNVASGVTITPNDTLIILDEIQNAPKAFESLKYFCEDAPEYHIMVAGSLLGVAVHTGVSYPVGKVDILQLYPLSFREFLYAVGEKELSDALITKDYALIDTFCDKYIFHLKNYYYVGGMPEAVLDWTTQEDVLNIREIQNRIINSYANDISKHAGAEAERIRMVWNSIPAQLAKDNKKFIYGAVKKGGRAKDFEVAIQWLVDAGLVHKIYRSKSPEMPLKFYEDFNAFKLFLLDVGLLGALTNASPAQMIVNNDVFKEFKGAFTENYVLQQIVPDRSLSICYFSKDNSKIEIDFLVQTYSRLIPIEVKAEENVKSKSLRQFITIDHPDKNLKGLRCSMKPYIDQGWMENIPLYSILGYINKQLEKEKNAFKV